MSLPFLKPKQMAALVRSKRGDKSQDVKAEVIKEADDMPEGMMSMADEMMQAIHSKSVHGLAKALKAHKEMAMPIPEPEESDK